jgi:thymidylate kinase
VVGKSTLSHIIAAKLKSQGIKNKLVFYTKEKKLVNKLKKEIADLKNHTCYACGQQMHDSKKETVLADKEKSFSFGSK